MKPSKLFYKIYEQIFDLIDHKTSPDVIAMIAWGTTRQSFPPMFRMAIGQAFVKDRPTAMKLAQLDIYWLKNKSLYLNRDEQ